MHNAGQLCLIKKTLWYSTMLCYLFVTVTHIVIHLCAAQAVQKWWKKRRIHMPLLHSSNVVWHQLFFYTPIWMCVWLFILVRFILFNSCLFTWKFMLEKVQKCMKILGLLSSPSDEEHDVNTVSVITSNQKTTSNYRSCGLYKYFKL